ncbi:Nitrogen permease regulator 2 [Tulasnella sp. 403]|nr:Nitrogen permease regulator 2 [Tulasnella sp. 403]
MIDSLILNPQSTSAGGADPNINDEAFLPRILSIFYATFDAHTGPRIVYQVPEGSIGVSQNPPDSATSMRSPSFSASSIRSPSLAFTPAGFASGAPGAIQDTLAGLGEPEPLSLGGTRAQSLASMTPSDDVSPAAKPNWDLTMAKVVQYIDGVHHVRKIADLADTDIVLTRLCMEHLLFYQCVLMVDIFQYSNVYALKPAVQWLASDASVIAECGPYVTRPGHTQLPWPKLLQLYSRLKRGKTVHDWIEENDIANQGIDPRRFVSFGVIKGFVRRVHRYPILVPREKSSKKKRVGPGSQSRNWTAEEIEALFGAFKDSGLGTISTPVSLLFTDSDYLAEALGS